MVPFPNWRFCGRSTGCWVPALTDLAIKERRKFSPTGQSMAYGAAGVSLCFFHSSVRFWQVEDTSEIVYARPAAFAILCVLHSAARLTAYL